jgi:menaquinone-dependent protoporphyrinogen IX oxidase
VRAVVIFESLTGNTAQAGELIAAGLRDHGAEASAYNITQIDHAVLSRADLVVVGSWTDGVFLFGQRPGRAGRLKAMPTITGKRAAVYCTYALAPGKTLQKMQSIVESRGGEVIGGMTIRRDRLEERSAEFVDRLASAVSV